MSKKANTIIAVIVAIITLVLIVTVIICAVKNGRKTENPEDSSIETTQSSDKPEVPVIPPISTDTGGDTEDKPDNTEPDQGEVNIDVERPVNESRNDQPGVEGDVVIFPGVKGDEE